MSAPTSASGSTGASTAAAIPPLSQSPPRKVSLLVEPTPFTHVSGYSNRFKEMLRYLQQAGDDAEVITPDNSANRPDDFLGFPIIYVPGFRLIFYRQVQLTLDIGFKAYRRLKQYKPDVMHVAAPGFFLIPAILYARLLGIPLVISYHTHLSVYAARYVPWPGLKQIAVWFTNLVLPFFLNKADLVLATSPQLKQQLEEIGCKRIDVWRKGIDTDVFSPEYKKENVEMRSLLTDGHPEAPLLLYVGRLGTEKRIEQIKEVLARIPSARLAIVGAGPAEESLKAHFAHTPTVFTGLLAGESLSRAYAAGDVFVMPSDSETLGFVVLEAMASGVPTVCANAGGLPNLVVDGTTGTLFPPNDVDAMTECVRQLIEGPELRAKMGAAAREETLKWNWQAATSLLRNEQYARAEQRFAERARNRGWIARRLFGGAPQDDDSTTKSA